MEIERKRLQKEIKELEKENKYLKEKFGDEVDDVILTNKKQISSLQKQLYLDHFIINEEAIKMQTGRYDGKNDDSTPISVSDLPDPSEFNEGGMVDDLREMLDFRIRELNPNEYANFADSYKIDPEDAMEMSNFIYSLNADEVKEITKVLDSKNYAIGGEIQVDRWLKLLGPEKYRKYVDDAFSKMKFQKLSNDKNIYRINTITDKSRTGEFGDLMDFYFTERLEKEGIGYAKGGKISRNKLLKMEGNQIMDYYWETQTNHYNSMNNKELKRVYLHWFGNEGYSIEELESVDRDEMIWDLIEDEKRYKKGYENADTKEYKEEVIDELFYFDGYAKGGKMMSEDDNPCWEGYKMYGMKKKGSKEVPNCVPEKKKLSKGGKVKFDDSPMMKKLWNERGYDIPYLESLSNAELKGIYETEFDDERTYNFETNRDEIPNEYAKGGKIDEKRERVIDYFINNEEDEELISRMGGNGEEFLEDRDGNYDEIYERISDNYNNENIDELFNEYLSYAKGGETEKEKEKFECDSCGVFYWVDDRDNFECPNCEEMGYDKQYAQGGLTNTIEAYKDSEGRGYSIVIDGAVFEMNEGTLPNNSVDMYVGERSEYPSDVSHWGKKITYKQLPIVIKDKITARSGIAVEKKNLGGFLFGATVGGYVGYKYGLTKEKKQVRDLFKSEQKYAQKAREKWGKKKSEPQYEDVIDVDFEEYKYAKGGDLTHITLRHMYSSLGWWLLNSPRGQKVLKNSKNPNDLKFKLKKQLPINAPGWKIDEIPNDFDWEHLWKGTKIAYKGSYAKGGELDDLIISEKVEKIVEDWDIDDETPVDRWQVETLAVQIAKDNNLSLKNKDNKKRAYQVAYDHLYDIQYGAKGGKVGYAKGGKVTEQEIKDVTNRILKRVIPLMQEIPLKDRKKINKDNYYDFDYWKFPNRMQITEIYHEEVNATLAIDMPWIEEILMEKNIIGDKAKKEIKFDKGGKTKSLAQQLEDADSGPDGWGAIADTPYLTQPLNDQITIMVHAGDGSVKSYLNNLIKSFGYKTKFEEVIKEGNVHYYTWKITKIHAKGGKIDIQANAKLVLRDLLPIIEKIPLKDRKKAKDYHDLKKWESQIVDSFYNVKDDQDWTDFDYDRIQDGVNDYLIENNIIGSKAKKNITYAKGGELKDLEKSLKQFINKLSKEKSLEVEYGGYKKFDGENVILVHHSIPDEEEVEKELEKWFKKSNLKGSYEIYSSVDNQSPYEGGWWTLVIEQPTTYAKGGVVDEQLLEIWKKHVGKNHETWEGKHEWFDEALDTAYHYNDDKGVDEDDIVELSREQAYKLTDHYGIRYAKGGKIKAAFYRWGEFEEEEEIDPKDIHGMVVLGEETEGFDVRDKDEDKVFLADSIDIDDTDHETEGYGVKRSYAIDKKDLPQEKNLYAKGGKTPGPHADPFTNSELFLKEYWEYLQPFKGKNIKKGLKSKKAHEILDKYYPELEEEDVGQIDDTLANRVFAEAGDTDLQKWVNKEKKKPKSNLILRDKIHDYLSNYIEERDEEEIKEGEKNKKGITPKEKRWSDLHDLIWDGAKCNDEECTILIPKKYTLQEVEEQMERFNDNNLEWRIYEDIEESDDGKHWVLESFNDEHGYAKGGKTRRTRVLEYPYTSHLIIRDAVKDLKEGKDYKYDARKKGYALIEVGAEHMDKIYSHLNTYGGEAKMIDERMYSKGGEVSLYFQQGSSDKEYHIQLKQQGEGYVVNFQYGRKGKALKAGTKTATPVSLPEAEKIYNKLLSSKVSKGYVVDASVQEEFSGNPVAPKTVHKLPQLLNMVFTTNEFINDDSYLAQEKMDGERRLVIINPEGSMGLNKKGQEVPLPNKIINSINNDCVIDGEIIGNTLYAFDILSLDGVDLEGDPCVERISTLNTLKFGDGVKVVKTAYNTEEKQELFNKLEREHREGIVFKKKDAPYTHGRPNSGGNQLKYKFYKTATFIVANITPGKRSVGLELLDNGNKVFMGKVTIPPNQDIPKVGDFVEVRYLYAYKGGAIFQPTYLSKREDSDLTDATLSQIIYKSDEPQNYSKGGEVGIEVDREELDFLNNEVRMIYNDFFDDEDEDFVDMIKTLMKKIDEAYPRRPRTLYLTNSEKSYLSEQISMLIGEYQEGWDLDLKELEDLQNKLDSYAKGGDINEKVSEYIDDFESVKPYHDIAKKGKKVKDLSGIDDPDEDGIIGEQFSFTLDEEGRDVLVRVYYDPPMEEITVFIDTGNTGQEDYYSLQDFDELVNTGKFAKGGKLTKRQKDLKELIWLKWNDESDFKIPKTYTQEEVEEQVERYNNAHIDTDISDDWIEEWNQEEKYWLLNKIKYDEDEEDYAKGGKISEKDKFWDEHHEDLIKMVGDNPDYFRDYLLSIGLTQDDVDAEMDGTSKHIAITILNMSDIETLNEFLNMDKDEDTEEDETNYLDKSQLPEVDTFWTNKKSKEKWKLTWVGTERFNKVVDKKDKSILLEDTLGHHKPVKGYPAQKRESIESLLKNWEPSKYAKGGTLDYFEHYDKLPKKMQSILDGYFEKYEKGEVDYKDTKKLLKSVEKEGYTFEYGLDNEPYDLKKFSKMHPLNKYISKNNK